MKTKLCAKMRLDRDDSAFRSALAYCQLDNRLKYLLKKAGRD